MSDGTSGRDLRSAAALGVVVVVSMALGGVAMAAAAGAQGSGGSATLGAHSVTVDLSKGSEAGTVWLVSSVSEAEPTDLFVGVGIARLPESPLEHSFVVRAGADGTMAGTAESVAELVGSGRTVVEVKVGPQAHDEVRHLIARWQAGEQEGTDPPLRVENLLDRVARRLDLKTPYRSALSGSDPAAYLRDLARINGGG